MKLKIENSATLFQNFEVRFHSEKFREYSVSFLRTETDKNNSLFCANEKFVAKFCYRVARLA